MNNELREYFSTFLGNKEDYILEDYEYELQQFIDEFNKYDDIVQIGYTEVELYDGSCWVDIMYSKVNRLVTFELSIEDDQGNDYNINIPVRSIGEVPEDGFLNHTSYTELCSMLWNLDIGVSELLKLTEI